MATEGCSIQPKDYLRANAQQVLEIKCSKLSPRGTMQVYATLNRDITDEVAIIAWHWCLSLDGKRYWVQSKIGEGTFRWDAYTIDELDDTTARTFAAHFQAVLRDCAAVSAA